MKWIPSPRRSLQGLLLGALFAVLPAASAAPLDRARDCLDRFDLPCAIAEQQQLLGSSPDSSDALRVRAWVAFHEGRYDDAVELIDKLKARGVDVEGEEPWTPYRPTATAAVGLVEARGDGVLVRHAPGVDLVLADQGVEALEKARSAYDSLFGGGPKHPIVLDIYPTGDRFIAASGLPPESVQTTNVIALSKWTRLLVTSPRALMRGYGWKDTVAHEYIHLVVAARTQNRAPVWLQEGLAKHLEGWWRGEKSGGLSANHESELAEAVRTNGFVPFEKFARSMAYLDSSEEAALAFAQVSTMIRFLLEKAGVDVLPELMDRVRDGEDSKAVVADLAGFADWGAFEAGWKAWLRTLPLVQQELATLPVVLDGETDEFASDPLLAGRPDLARYTRLGDLLREAGKYKAALIEYDKANDPEGPPSPTLLARKAEAWRGLGELERALALAEEGARLYPEFSLIQVTRARLLDQLGRQQEAVAAWATAQDINPYDPEVHRALVRGYEALGKPALAKRHLRYQRILSTAGALSENESGSKDRIAP